MTKFHRFKLNTFKVGYDCTERLPIPPRKKLRSRMPYKLDAGRWDCPVCRQSCITGGSLEAHYLDKHAVVDPDLTTHQAYRCKKCGEAVRTKAKLGDHRLVCKAWKITVPREGETREG